MRASEVCITNVVECHVVIVIAVLLPDDVLKEDKGECVICLDDLCQGDTIARLPCLCIYHKRYLMHYPWQLHIPYLDLLCSFYETERVKYR
jgi:hypothetical protein